MLCLILSKLSQGEIVGDIRRKNCTTIFNPFTETDKNFYFFRLQCPKVMYTYTSSILITPRTGTTEMN